MVPEVRVRDAFDPDHEERRVGDAELRPANVERSYGLDPPAAVVEVERVDQPPVVLLLGRRNPPATGVYAQVGANGRVVLTGALALWDFDKAARSLSPTAAAQ